MKKTILSLLLLLPFAAQAQDANYERLERRVMAIEKRAFSGSAGGGEPQAMADFEVRLQQIEDQSRQVYGGVEELSHAVEELARKLDVITKDQDVRLKDLEEKIGGLLAVRATAEKNMPKQPEGSTFIPLDIQPEQHYQKAYNYLTTASYDEAEDWFKAFVDRFPTHKYAENSHYWLGEVYLVKKQPKDAVISFTNGLKAFPDGPKVPGNLLKMGVAFKRLEEFEHAKSTWKKLLEEFPDSAEAQKAQKMLDELG